jgi:hypothetical protein
MALLFVNLNHSGFRKLHEVSLLSVLSVGMMQSVLML